MSTLPILVDGRPASFGNSPDHRKPTKIIRVRTSEGDFYDIIINASTPIDALHDRLESALGTSDYEYIGLVYSRPRTYRIPA